MKNLTYCTFIFITFLLLLSFSACKTVKKIGRVNMISIRNVEPNLEYSVITTYSGGSKRELRKTKATTIEDAVTQTVRKIPGGEFIMNATIYKVAGTCYAVEGDVWGTKTNVAYRGFKVGDKVMWKVMGVFKEGVIRSLKNDKTCYIETEGGTTVEKKYDEISLTD